MFFSVPTQGLFRIVVLLSLVTKSFAFEAGGTALDVNLLGVPARGASNMYVVTPAPMTPQPSSGTAQVFTLHEGPLKNSQIEPSKVELVAASDAAQFFSLVNSSLVVERFYFNLSKSMRLLRMLQQSTATVSDCAVSQNSFGGGLFQFDSGSLAIKNVSFLASPSRAYTSLIDSTGSGGNVHLESSMLRHIMVMGSHSLLCNLQIADLSVKNCLFHNITESSGYISPEGPSNLNRASLESVTIEDGAVHPQNGLLVSMPHCLEFSTHNCTFQRLREEFGGISKSSASSSSSSPSFFPLTPNTGRVIVPTTSSQAIYTSSGDTYTDLTADDRGAAIYMRVGKNLTINTSNFTNCSVTESNSYGGAVFVGNEQDSAEPCLDVQFSLFEQCKANGFGGGVSSSTAFSVRGATKFIECEAYNHGGAHYIRWLGGQSDHTGTIFTSNTVQYSYGGALWAIGMHHSLYFSAVMFQNNSASAGGGGALALIGNPHRDQYVSFAGCAFVRNLGKPATQTFSALGNDILMDEEYTYVLRPSSFTLTFSNSAHPRISDELEVTYDDWLPSTPTSSTPTTQNGVTHTAKVGGGYDPAYTPIQGNGNSLGAFFYSTEFYIIVSALSGAIVSGVLVGCICCCCCRGKKEKGGSSSSSSSSSSSPMRTTTTTVEMIAETPGTDNDSGGKTGMILVYGPDGQPMWMPQATSAGSSPQQQQQQQQQQAPKKKKGFGFGSFASDVSLSSLPVDIPHPRDIQAATRLAGGLMSMVPGDLPNPADLASAAQAAGNLMSMIPGDLPNPADLASAAQAAGNLMSMVPSSLDSSAITQALPGLGARGMGALANSRGRSMF